MYRNTLDPACTVLRICFWNSKAHPPTNKHPFWEADHDSLPNVCTQTKIFHTFFACFDCFPLCARHSGSCRTDLWTVFFLQSAFIHPCVCKDKFLFDEAFFASCFVRVLRCTSSFTEEFIFTSESNDACKKFGLFGIHFIFSPSIFDISWSNDGHRILKDRGKRPE